MSKGFFNEWGCIEDLLLNNLHITTITDKVEVVTKAEYFSGRDLHPIPIRTVVDSSKKESKHVRKIKFFDH
jgi:hypothetical protein